MDATLQDLLKRVAGGDYDALPALADLLEQRGDERAALARAASTPDVRSIADMLMQMRGNRGASDGSWVTASAAGVPVPGSLIDRCIREVEEAVKLQQVSAEIAKATSLARRQHCAELLMRFGD